MTVSTTGALIEGVTPADRIALDWTLDRAGKQLTSGKLLSGDAGTPGSFRIGLGALEPGRYALDVWATDGADYSVHQEFTVDGADTSRPAPAASSGFPSTTPAPPTSFSGTRLSPPSPASTTSAPAHLPPATRPLSAPPIADGPTTG